MRHRYLASVTAIAASTAFVCVSAAPLRGQTPAAAAKKPSSTRQAAPRTPWGDPNLQGTWNFSTVTPLERPDAFGNKQVLDDEEVAQENHTADTRAENRPKDAKADLDLAYNQEWWDRGKSIGRTSLIVDPPDGRIPPLSPEGQKAEAARAEARRGRGPFDSWEDRSLGERCIVRPTAGPPMLSFGYNNNIQLLQTPEYVVILNEQIHDARIIPMDRRPHLSSRVQQWMGDSRGHWEGQTLVIDTTNFSEKSDFHGSRATLHLIERFTRTDANSMKYEFTVDDPHTFSRSWTASLPMRQTHDLMFEYACHEGNYSLANVLSGARAQEKRK
jgi:hypothetical protein